MFASIFKLQEISLSQLFKFMMYNVFDIYFDKSMQIFL